MKVSTLDHKDLIHLVYVSKAVRLFSEEDHITLLQEAREFNSQHNITGMLLYKDMSFMQLIEGPKAVVKELFSKIEDDPRHTRVEVLLEDIILERQFSDWYMGFANLKNATLSQEQGYSDFLKNEDNLLKLAEEPSLALKLLLCFRAYS
jgi:hypothetical protein